MIRALVLTLLLLFKIQSCFATHTISAKLPIVYEKSFESGYVYYPLELVCGGDCWDLYDLATLTVTIPDEVSEYKAVKAYFYYNGRIDDGVIFYVNDQEVKRVHGECTASDCTIMNNWTIQEISFDFDLTQKTNTVKIQGFNENTYRQGQIYNAKVTVKAVSKGN